jgi:hypothetical protein
MEISVAVAQKTAEAAVKAAEAGELHAKAVVRSELPIVVVQKIKVEGDPHEGQVEIAGERMNYPTIHCSIVNYGRTPAELEGYLLDYQFTKRLPDVPDYNPDLIHPLTPGTMLLPQRSDPDPRTELNISRKFTLNQRLRDALTKEDVFMWVYGYVRYRDFLGEPHETRFVAMALIRSGMRPPQWFPTVYGSELGKWFDFVYGSETPAAYSQRT